MEFTTTPNFPIKRHSAASIPTGSTSTDSTLYEKHIEEDDEIEIDAGSDRSGPSGSGVGGNMTKLEEKRAKNRVKQRNLRRESGFYA